MADKKISQLTAATTPLAGSEVLPIVQANTTVKVSVADVTKGRTIQTTGINDNNNNEVITITTTASAVNELTIANAATGANPVISATGTDTNIGITLTPKGTGNAVLTSGNFVPSTAAKGINFTANTHAAGMTSQLLNWYEEGAWTPTVFGSTTAGTATYVVQVGRYTKIGNTVICHANVGISAHTGTGNILIGGLPFTSANVNNIAYAGSFAEVGNLALTANNVVTMYLAQNDNAIYIIQYPVGGGAASGVAMDTNFNIAFSITYQAG